MWVAVGRVWVLDTETKGTGASMVPLEKAQKKVEPRKPAPRRPKQVASEARARARGQKPRVEETSTALAPGHVRKTSTALPAGHVRKTSTALAPDHVRKTSTSLPPGHVRKKGTGEIGQVQAVDPRAGTARVRWLKGGRISTVPLSAVSRR
jgi:hypothetical protein